MTELSAEATKLRERFMKRLADRGIKPATQEELDRAANPPRCEPNCPECGGQGYVYTDPKARPGEDGFGKLQSCSRYVMRMLKNRAARGEWDMRLGITASEIDMAWNLVDPGASDGAKAVEAVRSKLQAGHGMVLLIGTYGQGKTLVGKILVAESIRAGRRAAYANMARILDDIRLAFDSVELKSTELLRRMDWWNGLDVLFIDELDKMNRTDWAQERMFELLDRRYVRAVRQEALTVVATNSPLGELDGYLRSRLNDNRLGPIVELQGQDGRLTAPIGSKF